MLWRTVSAAALICATLVGAPAAPSEAQTCNDGAVQRGGPGGDYYLCVGDSWTHIVPTFDPNSADGYGPNQPLPPLCVRFPDQYNCAQ
jgi:hypothetical protein